MHIKNINVGIYQSSVCYSLTLVHTSKSSLIVMLAKHYRFPTELSKVLSLDIESFHR